MALSSTKTPELEEEERRVECSTSAVQTSRDDERYIESGMHCSGKKLELTTLFAVGHGGESIT